MLPVAKGYHRLLPVTSWDFHLPGIAESRAKLATIRYNVRTVGTEVSDAICDFPFPGWRRLAR